jgi:AICAR transformylase/IMP cyclohydrolase PurH
MRFRLAIKAFAHTTAYDAAVFQTLPDYDLETGLRTP